MKNSTYIITLLLSIIVPSLAASASEMKDDEKTDLPYDINSIKPIPLDMKPYEKWPKNREMVYSPRLFGSQGFEDIVNTKDERKKMSNLELKMSVDKAPANIAKYIVKIHSYYGDIMGKEIAGDGTATIIKKEEGIIYLLTCAHNIVKYEDLDPFNPESKVSYFYAKSVSFTYEGKRYPCNKYYIHPHYNEKNDNKDIAIVSSHRGFEYSKYCSYSDRFRFIFKFDCFPEILSSSSKGYIIGYPKGYDGYIIGYPGEKEKTNHPYGMKGHLNISGDFIEYGNIDTSKGQSGSPVLAKINGVYKIIGIHTIMGIKSNWGICMTQDIIQWEKGCWFKTKELYDRHARIFKLETGMEQILEESNFDVNMIGKDKRTPFLYAAEKGKLPVLKLLKEKGADVDTTDEYGKNALHLAIKHNANHEVIEWLVNVAKVNVNAKADEGVTPFLCAVKKNNLPVLKLLKEKGTDVDTTDEYGKKALYLAINADYQNNELIEWLVNITKFNINTKNKWGKKPFFCAVREGNLPVLKFLKEKGANVNETDEEGYNALYWAIEYNAKYEVINWLVTVAKVNVNAKNIYGMTPFLYAAEKGKLPVLKLLKEKGADVDTTHEYGKNALHWAIENNAKFKVIKWLVNVAKVNVNAKNYKQRTPFLFAAEKGNLRVLKFLKEKGADVNATGEYGYNALNWAFDLWPPNYEVIEWLVNVDKFNVNAKGYWKRTPFLCAAQKNNLPVLKILKEKGADVNATDKDCQNALHLAIKHNANYEVIEWLVNVDKFNVNAKGYWKRTPFLLAAKKGNLRVLKFLKEKGANIHEIDFNGQNALHLASSWYAKYEVIEWLVNVAKFIVNAKNKEGMTPFLCAASGGNLPALKLLKEQGANIHEVDFNGQNALHLVIKNKANYEVIEWLVNVAKVSVNTKNKDGITPFLWAAEKGNLPVLKFLKEKGADVHVTDEDGFNAIYWAVSSWKDNYEVVEWLVDVAKVNVNAKNKRGVTPFLCAAEKGKLPVLKLMKEKGANVDTTDKDGNNALNWSIQHNAKYEVIEWLKRNVVF